MNFSVYELEGTNQNIKHMHYSNNTGTYIKIQQLGITIGILVGLLLITGAVFWWNNKQSTKNNVANVWQAFFGESIKDDTGLAESSSGLENLVTYTNEQYGFSVGYPEGYSVEMYDEGDDAKTFVFKGGEDLLQFQVFVEPIEEKGIGLVTQNAVHEAFPNLHIVDPQYVVITGMVKGLLFWSSSPNIGKTRELWMATNGFLYQITTRAENDSWLAKVMSTWKFPPH